MKSSHLEKNLSYRLVNTVEISVNTVVIIIKMGLSRHEIQSHLQLQPPLLSVPLLYAASCMSPRTILHVNDPLLCVYPSNAASVQQILSQKRKKCPLSGNFQNPMRPVLFIFHITRRLTSGADCRSNRCTVSSRIALIRYAVEPKDVLSTSSQTSTSD